MQLGRVLPKSPQGPSWLEVVHGEKKDGYPAWATLRYQVHVSTDRAFARSFWATLPRENRGGWEGCEPLQLRHDPTPSVAFGVRSRDTSQISASVCSFVSSPLRHEQTPSGRRVSGPTEEVERMPCFTDAGNGSRTQILLVRTHAREARWTACGTRNSSTKRFACFALPFYRACRSVFVSFGKRLSDRRTVSLR